MQLRTVDKGDVRLITVAEKRIDAAVAIQFKDAVRAAAGDGSARVVVDLSAVSFLDSSGLGSLVAAVTLGLASNLIIRLIWRWHVARSWKRRARRRRHAEPN